MNDSVVAFGQMLAEQELPLDLTPAEQDAALETAERDLRKNHFNEIQNLRKRGEILHNAKRSAPGKYLAWQQEMRELYAQTEGQRGFTYSEKTCENYVNLHLLYFHYGDTYEQYRHWPAWIVYQVASYVLNERDPETVPAIAAVRNGTVAAIPESTGGATVQGCGVPEEYPALVEMCEAGDISQLAALRLVDECATVTTIVRDAVALWGVRGVKELQTLCDIEASIERARENNEPYNNIFVEAVNTQGFASDEHGDPVPLRDMSSRELWAAHRRSRYQGTDGDNDSGGGAKSKNLFKGMLRHDSVMAVARAMNASNVVEQISNDMADQLYSLKLDKPL